MLRSAAQHTDSASLRGLLGLRLSNCNSQKRLARSTTASAGGRVRARFGVPHAAFRSGRALDAAPSAWARAWSPAGRFKHTVPFAPIFWRPVAPHCRPLHRAEPHSVRHVRGSPGLAGRQLVSRLHSDMTGDPRAIICISICNAPSLWLGPAVARKLCVRGKNGRYQGPQGAARSAPASCDAASSCCHAASACQTHAGPNAVVVHTRPSPC